MKTPIIVAMLATHKREKLLLERAVPSVLSQSRPPNTIVVVEDEKTEALSKRLAFMDPALEYLCNRRTKGLSGALNTGLDHITRNYPDPAGVFVAFLDDDDMWMPDHLAAVETCIREGAEVIATPFLRLEPGREPRKISPPAAISQDLFMRGNPGIQGSNLVVCLDLLLKAGTFNEALPSCTDRDLLIRICNLPDVRFATIAKPTVTHYSCAGRPRLSLPGSVAKLAGLDMFDRIHGPLMPKDTRQDHLDRAARLFNWNPSSVATSCDFAVGQPSAPPDGETPPLLIGVIVDGRRIQSASRLLDDLADRVADEGLAPPDVLLLENRSKVASTAPLEAMIARHRTRLRIRVIRRSELLRLARSGDWKQEGTSVDGRLAISDARTALQACLYHMARERPGCAIWILDDDMRLDPLLATGTGTRRSQLALGEALRRMRATGADICIGTYTGAPPLPAIASVRGQLVDLMWNLRRLSAQSKDALVPAAEPRNASLRHGRRDYYYDLSRLETDRLETPFALEPANPTETCGEALIRLADMIPRILAGEAPLRPLLADPAEIQNFSTGEALHRGGNTFIFDPEALADMPNISPTVGGRPTRRSDMIWSFLQARHCGRKVVSVPVPVRHERIDLPAPDELDHIGVADDIRGFAIFNALKEAWGEPEKVEFLCAKFEEERLAALRLSFHRVRGITHELLAWCQNEAPVHVPQEKLTVHGQRLLRLFSQEAISRIERGVYLLGASEVGAFLKGLDARISAHAKRTQCTREIPKLLADERSAAARDAILGIENDINMASVRVLGQGEEGVSLTDQHRIWKLFDRWSPGKAALAAPILQRLVNSPVRGQALIRPLAMRNTPIGWLLIMPFEPSEPWTGGHGPAFVELLADLHRAGLACRNLHPKNLRLAGDVVRLIDYGADLVPLADPKATSLEFVQMCRRAWLCWRWWWREDISELMHKSLTENDMPELVGHEGLINAVRERLGLREIPDPVMVRALEIAAPRVLDYGAGKGKQAVALARAGADVVAWDPNPGVKLRLEALCKFGVRRVASAVEAVESGPYDLVICRRVACLLDDEALSAVLKDIRAAVATNGRVLFALCHPAYVHRVRTAEAEPVSQPCKCAAAPWGKRVRSTGRILHEVHRSERLLRRKIARAGFRVVERKERLCTDFDRFETVADLLVLELEPTPKTEVSLLIKACAMDAAVLEIQVNDILTALEGPGAFCEIILALDTRIEGFTRTHTSGDLDALRKAAERLRVAGEIDKIVETPAVPGAMRTLNRRWFGLDLAATHSEGGAATGALLAGFEACTSPRVLHTDVDMMIGTTNSNHDPLAMMVAALDAYPEAVTASFPVARAELSPWTAEGPGGPWRVESRLGIVYMTRMKATLPLPNDDAGGMPRLSWHRALDEAVRYGPACSLRGGGYSFCVHPPNVCKTETDAWEEVRACIARGIVPLAQHERIEWSGTVDDWRQPERKERFVFVICGRNVVPERFRRCWDSVLHQENGDWGAVVIDDASETWISDEIGRILAPHAAKVSFIPRRRRAGLMANTAHAIRHLCTSPDQVIVTLDADDSLIGCRVLDRLAEEYDRGADLTVGSMLRTDKRADYPVCLEAPRRNRGGNVWQHLRSFRKGLFDGLPDAVLRLDGTYVDLATDWAFMLPMVEAAQHPVWIREALYLHEPGEARDPARVMAREEIIAALIIRDVNSAEWIA